MVHTVSGRKRTLRMRRGSPLACLGCYLIAFSVPLLWQYTAIRLIYPWKLASTAPDIAAHLLSTFPFLHPLLQSAAAMTAETAAPLREVLAAREEIWLAALTAGAMAAWLISLFIQLIWRVTHRSPLFSARQTARAVRSYRIVMLVILVINAAAAALIWLFGARFIPGRTLWDYLVCFGVFALIPPAAAFVSRFAASSAISGRHGFFKRL